ncbi:FCD domain-containing protein [Caballeronia sp. LZ035]|uniref:FadR/GntR family transcriptional regulator n=1 Tax=Caballeronia sp. LZ035 TaxID=3038568 RepID=UPI00285B9C7A|nr:FCD domain-containing protein [Caballeronia sp. LZ035]MDR5760556.1 FCD domain-containing protein [Caballeronia sp. LZ035]
MSTRPSASYLGKSQTIAQELLAKIAESNLEPGQTFATEADLLSQYDVSRPTLRESVRILEAQGVLEQRPGPGGGLVVRRPSLDMLAEYLSIYLRFNGVPFLAVLKAREVIEPALAAEAAQHGTDEDFDALEASIDRMKTGCEQQEEFVTENRTFHSVIARASGNKVLETFWGTISLLAHGEHHGVRYTFGNRRHVIAAHERILAACRGRDAGAAAEAMSEHVGALEHLVRDHYKHLLKKPTTVRDRHSGR